MGCHAAEQRIAALVTGELDAGGRLELEAHAARCLRCDEALRDAALVSTMLDRIYAPLRKRSTLLSPARVRLAVRAPEPALAPSWLRIGMLGRLSEATMALGFAALLLGGTLDAPVPVSPVSPPSVLREYFRAQPPADDQGYLRWMRLHAPAVPDAVSPVRLPAGGIFDGEPGGGNDDGWRVAGSLG